MQIYLMAQRVHKHDFEEKAQVHYHVKWLCALVNSNPQPGNLEVTNSHILFLNLQQNVFSYPLPSCASLPLKPLTAFLFDRYFSFLSPPFVFGPFLCLRSSALV